MHSVSLAKTRVHHNIACNRAQLQLHSCSKHAAYALDVPDPSVRNCHVQPIVKAEASLRYWPAQARHSGHILGNSDGLHNAAETSELLRENLEASMLSK